MDAEIIYSLVGIVIFIIIVIVTLRSDSATEIQSKEEKQYAIIDSYKKQLREALEPLVDDKAARVLKKKELLLIFNNELSTNIFFEQTEIREILSDLSENY